MSMRLGTFILFHFLISSLSWAANRKFQLWSSACVGSSWAMNRKVPCLYLDLCWLRSGGSNRVLPCVSQIPRTGRRTGIRCGEYWNERGQEYYGSTMTDELNFLIRWAATQSLRPGGSVNRLGGLRMESSRSRSGGTTPPWSVLASNLSFHRFYL